MAKRSTALFVLLAVTAVVFAASVPAHAQLSGAIFTTVSNGGRVNGNIYPSKDSVYLNGGPPPGAPATAAGLPDGTYVFQVTDPSGKTLLSTDIANCRQFTVSGGIITGVVNVGGCQHVTGVSIDHGATTVQLMPYLDTPNNGGEYKAWATPVADYLEGCDTLGVANGLSVVDCGTGGADIHGFIPSHSKTDNFKVKAGTANLEIDTHFLDSNNNLILGICENWIDTLGVSNPRCSEAIPAIGDLGWAHIEEPETGVEQIVLYSQPGCSTFSGGISQYVGKKLTLTQTFNGPTTLDIQVKSNMTGTITIDVYCNP